MKNKILVTGAGGFLGGHMVQRLLEQGENVIATDQKPIDLWYRDFREYRDKGKVQIDDRRNLRLLLPMGMFQDAHTVYHFAGNVGGSEFMIPGNNLSSMMNTQIDLNVIGMADRAQVDRLFYASIPPTEPGGLMLSKMFGERLCRYFNDEKGTKFTVGRLHNIYGPFDHFRGKRASVIPVTCRKVAEAKLLGREIVIRGTGLDTRSFTYVYDTIGLIQAVTEAAPTMPYEIGLPESHSVNDVLAAIFKVAGVEFLPAYDTSFNKVPTHRKADVANMQYGHPNTALEDGVRSTYQWVFEQVESDLRKPRRQEYADWN
jgi:GDP-D-mannose 3', 5'-epimerase